METFQDAYETGVDAARSAKQKINSVMPNKRGVGAGESGEGTMTKQIESVTSKVPSSAFLSFAFGSIALSAAFHLAGRKEDAQFVGQWVPTILIMGLYNKLVKLEGSE